MEIKLELGIIDGGKEKANKTRTRALAGGKEKEIKLELIEIIAGGREKGNKASIRSVS